MKKKSVATAIIIPLLITLILGIGTMTVTGSVLSSNLASDLTNQLIDADIDIAHEMLVSLPLDVMHTVDALAAAVVLSEPGSEYELEDPRAYTVGLFEGVLEHRDDLVCIWTAWEPNAFDGQDRRYVNAPYHDETGRFIPAVYVDGNTIAVDALVGYDDPVDGEYYQGPKSTRAPYMTAPYFYDFGGREVLLVTYSYPIIRDGNVVGVVGADFLVDKLIDKLENIHILGDGFVFVLAHDGTFVVYPDDKLIAEHYSTSWLKENTAQIERLLTGGGKFSAENYVPRLDSDVFLHAEGVPFGDKTWVLGGVASKNTALAPSRFMLFVNIGIGFAMLIVVSIIVYFIVRSKVRMLSVMTKAANAIAHGEIDIEGLDSGTEPTHNEVVQLERAFSTMIENFKEQAYILARIAEGDYTYKISARGEKDVINLAIELVIDGTLDVLNQVATAGVEVADTSRQIAEGAQTLSQGSTEQAASIQELSSSIAEIAAQTKTNAEKAENAASLSDAIRVNAEKGNRQMDEMMSAVQEINTASQNISKVIKVIDDIAFQTNILALNAAVEAARAGQHGKGFAVVAEEVRNLAAKSAEAAKETGDMIQNSMEKAELGSRIASETAVSFTEISEGINESSKIVSEIAQSSKEQSVGISQINVGVEQVAQVVQQNSATAEQSAAASEEMSAQSAVLRDLIRQFMLRGESKKKSNVEKGQGHD